MLSNNDLGILLVFITLVTCAFNGCMMLMIAKEIRFAKKELRDMMDIHFDAFVNFLSKHWKDM